MPTISSAETLKLCKDCEYVASSREGWENYRCKAEQNFLCINPVDGHREYKVEFCRELRVSSVESSVCGREPARWFKQRELPPLSPVTTLDEKRASREIKKGITADDL